MAATIGIPRSSSTSHVRSSSLPCDTHPLITSVEDQLQRLTSSLEASSSCKKLEGLKNLYDCVNDLLQLPCTQKGGISCETNSTVDGSLRLLDMCGSTRDVLSQMKECVRDLESSLRRSRRCGDQSSMMNGVQSFMTSRKELNREAWRLLKDMKKMGKKEMKNSEDMGVARVLKDVEKLSFQVLESLLSSVAQSDSRSKSNGWSLVFKPLRATKRVVSSGHEGESTVNEMESLDMELAALIKGKKKSSNVQCLLKRLESVESSVEEFEEGLECVYRRLLKTRVSLLNGSNQ